MTGYIRRGLFATAGWSQKKPLCGGEGFSKICDDLFRSIPAVITLPEGNRDAGQPGRVEMNIGGAACEVGIKTLSGNPFPDMPAD